MTAAPREYTRLPGRGRSFLGSSRLWLASDHLLAVEGRGYSESYRRFYYGDIQAIVICRTWRWLVTGGLLALALAPMVIAFFSVAKEFRPFWAVPGGVVLLLLLADLLSGPSCACRIKTAVQTANLPSLRRLRATRRAIERIRERVELAQGAWTGLPTPESSPQDAAPAPLPSRISPTPVILAPPMAPARRDSGRLHLLLFASLFADSGLTIAAITSKKNAVYGAGEILLLVEIGLTIAAIVRQRRTDLPHVVRRIVWATLVYLCVSVMTTILMSWIAMFQAFAAKAGAAPGERILALDVFGVIAPLLLGMAGSVVLRRYLRDREEAELSLFGPPKQS